MRQALVFEMLQSSSGGMGLGLKVGSTCLEGSFRSWTSTYA